MKMKYLHSTALKLGLLATALSATATISSQAQVIYSDSFSTASGTINGTSPDITDLTGDTYVGVSRGSGDPTYSNGSASTNFNGSDSLSLASGGNYTRGTTNVFTLSASLSVDTITGTGTINDPQPINGGNGDSTRGVGLGFLSALSSSTSTTGTDAYSAAFTGFALNQSGSLVFIADGVSSGEPSLAFTGTFNPASFYNLSYTVNTATGALTDVIFNGTDVTSTFASATSGDFTEATTQYVEFGASSSSAPATGLVDNLVVSEAAVPEPSTWAMLLGGFAVLLGVQRLHRKRGV